MELLPSLAGLSLAPDAEDEALPEPTDQAPAPQAALQQLPVVLKKYSNAKRYNAGLRSWKNTRSVRDRWNQGDRPGVPMFVAGRPLVNSKPRAYFEDDPDFYEGWMQVSQQECFFYDGLSRLHRKHRGGAAHVQQGRDERGTSAYVSCLSPAVSRRRQGYHG